LLVVTNKKISCAPYKPMKIKSLSLIFLRLRLCRLWAL
jgi:hypothetical protein